MNHQKLESVPYLVMPVFLNSGDLMHSLHVYFIFCLCIISPRCFSLSQISFAIVGVKYGNCGKNQWLTWHDGVMSLFMTSVFLFPCPIIILRNSVKSGLPGICTAVAKKKKTTCTGLKVLGQRRVYCPLTVLDSGCLIDTYTLLVNN